MIVFFPHSSLPFLAPAPQRVSKLRFILLSLQQQWPSPLSQSSISSVARARSLSLSPVRNPPGTLPNLLRTRSESIIIASATELLLLGSFRQISTSKYHFESEWFLFFGEISNFMEKMAQIYQILKSNPKKNSKSPDCYDKFQIGSQRI